MKSIVSRFKSWWVQKDDSPMGRFRLKEAAIIALVLLAIAFFVNKAMFIGWVTQAIVQFSKAGAAAFFFYWFIQRRVVHSRTHELTEKQQLVRENVLLPCYAILIACALSI